VNAAESPPRVSIVVIGRNEGPRLLRCLESLAALDYPEDCREVIYVDSGSTDGSRAVAEPLADRVLTVTSPYPTAAAGRNTGLPAARYDLVHFVDGDTVMHPAWLGKAVTALSDPTVCAVFGRVEEIEPRATIYNFWAHHDWYRPPGDAEATGGIALFRRDALVRVGGFDETLIAGEEPELCARLRRNGAGRIICLDEPMVRHDMNMTRFGQYWRRCMRTGHAYAEVSRMHPELHGWRRARVRNVVHTVAPVAALVLSLILRSPWPLVLWAVLIGTAMVRNAWRLRSRVGSLRGALLYSLHHYLAKMPMAIGQVRYWRSKSSRRQMPRLIEHRA
jgi:cellulose synthase/poly-beta-1,6-N-acetylglucosamine synthase-like glycosyltransferase